MANQFLYTVPYKELSSWSYGLLVHFDRDIFKFPTEKLGCFLKKYENKADLISDTVFTRITIKTKGQGVVKRDEAFGKDIKTQGQFYVRAGQFIYSNIDARNGAFGVVPKNLDMAIITNSFTSFECDETKLLPQYLVLLLSTPYYVSIFEKISVGTTNRRSVKPEALLNIKIPVPPIEKQTELVDEYNESIALSQECERKASYINDKDERYMLTTLGIHKKTIFAGTKFLNAIYFSSINEWGAEKNLNSIDRFYETKNAKALRDMSYLIVKVFRGKSPIYSDSSNAIILNQKCNRWNFIDIRYAKTVDEKWLSSIDKDYLIKQGDIIINSTGEGTLGRASIVDEQHEGLCVDSHILVLRLDKTKVNPEFILRQINSEYGQKQIELLKSALATKQTELGIDNLLKIKFITPIDSNGKIDLTTQNVIIDNHRSTLREMQTLLDRQRELIEFAKENFENAIFN